MICKVLKLAFISLIAANIFFAANCSAHIGNKNHLKFVFYNFYNQNVDLYIDDNIVYRGKINVNSENDSTGISKIIYFNLNGCSDIKIHAGKISAHKKICALNKVRIVYISPRRPHISTSESDTIMLD